MIFQKISVKLERKKYHHLTKGNIVMSNFNDLTSQKDSHKNISVFERLKLYLYIAKISFQPIKRNKAQVDKEYNSGIWNKPFEEIDFESPYGNYNITNQNAERIMVYDGKLIKGKFITFVNQLHKEIQEILEPYKNDPIMELGCGLGANLIMLNKMGFKNLSGVDISENAIESLRKYTKMKQYDIVSGVQDLNNLFLKDAIKDKIVFTQSCLEQCKHIMPNVLRNIINGKPKLIINFEVDYDASPFMVKRYFDAFDFQNNLVRELEKLEKQEKVEILSIKKRLVSHSPTVRTSIIIWKPKN